MKSLVNYHSMIDKLQNYIQCIPGYFWVWEEEGEVIAASNGRGTIVYTPLLLQTLEFIQFQGWPPFGALLLVMAATNKNADITLLLNHIDAAARELSASSVEPHFYKTEVEQLLFLLQKLPETSRIGTARMQLIQALFRSCHNKVGADRVAQWLPMLKQASAREALIIKAPEIKQREQFHKKLNKDFQCLGLIAKRFRTERDIQKAIADLPEVDMPEFPELPETGEALEPAGWLEALVQHPATFEVGALLKHLWAGLSVPMLFARPEGMPMGGLADLTNKGSLERMLLSEYANDDLVLLSRLANNEVLFLHPEASHEREEAERAVLMDVSLKNWGTCRVLVYALALAIARHPRLKDIIKVHAVGKHNYPVNYNVVQEVAASMRQPDAGLHAAAGMSQFFSEHPAHKKREVILVTSEEAADHAEVQKVISDNYSSFVCWIMVTAEGQVTVYRKVHNSKKLLQQMVLPLHSLWQKKKSPPPLPVAPMPEVKAETTTHYPLLCPAGNNIKALLGNMDEHWIVSYDRHLFRACDRKDKKGWEWIPYGLPDKSILYELGLNASQEKILLYFIAEEKKVGLLNLHTGNRQMLDFPEWMLSSNPQFFYYGNAFYYLKGKEYWMIDLQQQQPAIVRYPVVGGKMLQLYKNREQELKLLSTVFNKQGARPWIKSMQSLYINTEGQLVLNETHVLVLNNRGVMKWLLVSDERKRMAAAGKYSGKMEAFVFKDGSSVKVSDKGFLVLKMAKRNTTVLYDVVILPKHIESKVSYLRKYNELYKTSEALARAVHLAGRERRVLATFPSEQEAVACANELNGTDLPLEITPVYHPEKVYVPVVPDAALAMAAEYYFSGNEYYLPYTHENVTLRDNAEWYTHTVAYFTTHIMEHGTAR